MVQVSYIFLASDFNGPGSLGHIHFAIFIWNAVDPRCLRPRLSLMGFKVLEVYFIGIWIVLMLCLASSLLILLEWKCWYAIKALSHKQEKFNYMSKSSTGRLCLY